MSTKLNALYGQIGTLLIGSGLSIAHKSVAAMVDSPEKAKVVKSLASGHEHLRRAALTANDAVAFNTPVLASAGGPKRDAQNS